VLAEQGVKLIAMRCAGFDRVDVAAAAAHGIKVVRVPSYSPHAARMASPYARLPARVPRASAPD
jgi:phosphoglycerate dehydrogenase-like enzyme